MNKNIENTLLTVSFVYSFMGFYIILILGRIQNIKAHGPRYKRDSILFLCHPITSTIIDFIQPLKKKKSTDESDRTDESSPLYLCISNRSH